MFNKPAVSQVAALWVKWENANQGYSRHIQIYTKEGHSHRIQYYYDCDPLQYPLLFPFGEIGWLPVIQKLERGNPEKRKRKTMIHSCSATLSSIKLAEEMIDLEEEGNTHTPLLYITVLNYNYLFFDKYSKSYNLQGK